MGANGDNAVMVPTGSFSFVSLVRTNLPVDVRELFVGRFAGIRGADGGFSG